MRKYERGAVLVGRSRDLEALRETLEQKRLVTIIGPPGIGKTRLAESALEEHLAYDGLGAMADLTAATSVDDICRAVARALDVGICNGDTRSVVEQLGRAIASRGPMLMLLDNFEQVAFCAVETVGVWLRLAPEAQLLVTSRERLSLRAEVAFNLGPLSLPEEGGDPRAAGAVRLFVERARAVWRGYELTDVELPYVAAITQRFEGNPLAVELAAARMRVCSSAEILASLDLDLSSANMVDAPRRHASLRQAVVWSWGLLEPWEQDALGQCTAFQGGFGTLAAREVIDLSRHSGAPSSLSVIEALHNKSLLLRYDAPEEPGHPRFRLYVGVREFAREKLVENGGDRAAEERHARHFLREGRTWADAIEGASAVQGLRRFAVEMENLLAVHKRALLRTPQTVETSMEAIGATLVLSRFLHVRGPMRLLVSLSEAALSAPHATEVPDELRAAVRLAHGVGCHFLLRTSEAAESLDRALDLARHAGDQRLAGEIAVTLGWLLWRRVEDAEAAFAGALATEDPRLQADGFNMLAQVRTRQGRFADVVGLNEEARRRFRAIGAVVAEAKAIASLALAKAGAGQLDEACADFEAAHSALEALSLRRHKDQSCATWGVCEHARGGLEAADRLLGSALRAFREGGNPIWEGYSCVHLGILYVSLGRFGAARAYSEHGRSVLGGSGVIDEALALATLAVLDATDGRLDEATARFEAAEQGAYQDASVPALFWVMRGHLEIALAEAARAGRDARAAAKHEESARHRARCAPGTARAEGPEIDAEAPPVWLGLDVRLAQVSLERALARYHAGPSQEEPDAKASGALTADAPDGTLVLSLDHCWISPPTGERISLRRRPALARLLRGLSEQWARQPGAPLSIPALLRVGWPGEKMSEVAGAKRVYTAIWALRRSGLGQVLAQRDGGYLLEPDAPIRIIDVAALP